MKNESPYMLSPIHDTIDTRRGEDDEKNHNFTPYMMASKPHLKLQYHKF